MRHNKHYPNIGLLRRKTKQICQAVQTLTEQGVEVIMISFSPDSPVIEVANCPGTRSLHGVAIGQSRQNEGELHIKKTAHLNGCQIIWSEAV